VLRRAQKEGGRLLRQYRIRSGQEGGVLLGEGTESETFTRKKVSFACEEEQATLRKREKGPRSGSKKGGNPFVDRRYLRKDKAHLLGEKKGRELTSSLRSRSQKRSAT